MSMTLLHHTCILLSVSWCQPCVLLFYSLCSFTYIFQEVPYSCSHFSLLRCLFLENRWCFQSNIFLVHQIQSISYQVVTVFFPNLILFDKISSQIIKDVVLWFWVYLNIQWCLKRKVIHSSAEWSFVGLCNLLQKAWLRLIQEATGGL